MRKQLLAFALAAMTAAPAFAAETAPKTAATADAQIAQLASQVRELRHQLAAQGAELKRLRAALPSQAVILCTSGCPDRPAVSNAK